MLKAIATSLVILVLCTLTGCGDVKLGSFSPSAPAELRANGEVTISSTSAPVVLTWVPTNSTIPSQGATFNVYRGTSATGTTTGKVKIAEALKVTTFTDTPSAGTWYYQVTASIYDLESGPSNEVSVVQLAVTTPVLSGSSASGLNTLSWNVPAGAASYLLYRGTAASGSINDKVPLKFFDAVATRSYTDTAVTAGSTYYYQLVVRYGNGTSQTSNEVALKTQ